MTALWIALGALVAAVLLVPISVRARGAAGERELWGVAELRWGAGVAMARLSSEETGRVYLLGIPVVRLPSFSGRGDDAKKKKRKRGRRARKKERARREGAERRRSFFDVIGDGRRAATAMVARALGALHPRFYLGGTLGLGEPAETAMVLETVRWVRPLAPRAVELDLRDDYLEDTTQLYARVSMWLVPGEILWVAMTWLARADTRRILRGGWR